MASRVDRIKKYIEEIPFVEEIYSLEQGELFITGKIKISFEELSDPLDFELEIYPSYPLKSYDSESIIFKSLDLRKYKHVMGNGAICIHTTHHTNLKNKLLIDFGSLKNWIVKYYINKEEDTHYEHIIVNEKPTNKLYHAYIFTDIDHQFKKNDFGQVNLSSLSNGIYKGSHVSNYLVKSFIQDGRERYCKWSRTYLDTSSTNSGAFIFIEDAPATYGKFAFQNWENFKNLIPMAFLEYLYQFEQKNIKEFEGKFFPIFIGYRTIETEIHWQVAMMEIGKFPIKGIPEKIDNKKTGNWKTGLDNQEIIWSPSRNASYQYFFGRGALSKNITSKKILIIGIGAIGSMVAKTLVRGGCLNIDVADHDVKEPENVCRSEYLFNLGINDKGEELTRILSAISPFAEVKVADKDYFQTVIKILFDRKGFKAEFEGILNHYDIIIDCTADNDLMYILDSMNLKSNLINLSITNHAKELVCAFDPNTYQFVMTQFENVLDNDITDLYNPTGCWSPTFKASYNDINSYVQLAIKHINLLYEKELQKNNFIIKTDDSYPFVQRVFEF